MDKENYSVILADLEADKAEIESLIAYVKRKLGQGDNGASSEGQGMRTQSSNSAIPTDAFFGLSLVEAAKKYLSMVKAPKTAREIADALEGGGFKTTSQNFSNTVFSVLSREDKNEGAIAKVNRGFGLAEWYPGLKRSKQQTLNKPISAAVLSSVDKQDAVSIEDLL
jgi:hypothetical protein